MRDNVLPVTEMAEALKSRELLVNRPEMRKSRPELADAHCHIESLSREVLKESIDYGVKVIVANGVDLASNLKTLSMSDGINVFAAVGVHPEYSGTISDDELEKNMRLARDNRSLIVAIGEIGIDKKFATNERVLERQKLVFGRLVELAIELGLPVSVHTRDALADALEILELKGAKRVQLHFFEGDVEQAKHAADMGYMISIPPMESSRRKRVIKAVPMQNLLAETDAPVNNAVPKDVEKSIAMIAAAKGIGFDEAAAALMQNTRRFFNIRMSNLMR